MIKGLTIIIIFVSLFEGIQAQKGDKSISAGPLISFPLENNKIPGFKTGLGIEATGQYNISNKSAMLLQAGLTSFGRKQVINNFEKGLLLISLKGGYKCNIGSSGFFINGLAGADIEVAEGFSSISFTVGAGKRFAVKDIYIIDAGIDYIDADTERR